MARKRRRLIPYWLRGRGEICVCCDAPHEPAVTIRCAGCDRAFCALCVVTVESEHYCSDCEPERSRG